MTEGPEWVEQELRRIEIREWIEQGREEPAVIEYWWKPKPEAVRAVVIAGLIVLLQMLATTDVTTIEDWRAWAIGLGAGVLHAVVTAALAQFGPGGFRA